MTKSTNIDRQTILHFSRVWWSFRTEAILTIFIAVQAVCNSTLVPFWIGKILATLANSDQNALQYLPQLLVSIVVGVVANYVGFKALFLMQPKAMALLQAEALEALLKRSVGFHNNNIAGKLVAEATIYPTTYAQLTNAAFITLLQFVVALVSGIAIIAYHSLLLGLLVLVMTVSVLGVVWYQLIKAGPNRNQRHAARRVMTGHLADTISNAVTVKTFAQEQSELSKHAALSVSLAKYRTRDWTQIASDGSRRIAVLLGFEVAFVILIVQLVQNNPSLLGIGIFTFSYAINLANRLFDVGNIVRSIEDALLDASDMTRLLLQKPEIIDTDDAFDLKVTRGAIRFDAVNFRYSDADAGNSVFKALTVDIKAGEKVGLVGPSGGGKSTLTRLLLRFESIQAGSIRIDGQDIAAVKQLSLRQSIAYVPQEPLLFHRTIAENIAYGNPEVSEADLISAAKKAHALDFINALPYGMATVVGERGVKLSGGQRQRIAIARAIVKNASIIVLDEATSALDSESEAAIQAALAELMKGRTTIVIAHRLSTIQSLDRILVLQDGTVFESGTHKQLIKSGKLYAKLWAHQSGGFIED